MALVQHKKLSPVVIYDGVVPEGVPSPNLVSEHEFEK